MNLDSGQQRVADKVKPQLEAGEEVVAALTHSQTGPSPWIWSIVGYLFTFFIQYYSIAVTDRRVFFVKNSRWTARPSKVDQMYPRLGVTVKEFKEHTLWSVLRLDRPTAGEIKLNIPRVSRSGAEGVVAALGGHAS